MRISVCIVAIAAGIALAAPAHPALAHGKGTGDTPSVAPSDRPGDRPGGAPGVGGSRDSPAEPEPPPAARDEPPESERWNSIASAIWRVRGRVRVAIGY